ncbi:hypothetical protein IFM89_029447 [Coptis chinensis]|uniref:Uncharacterized protein n=1 Tax=Coptis chinensis TaxID=261450 RepID=A0A835LST3_9MAGN|nr:hypothetical protein IFM89_029447 [Coptis chinensis]
MALIWKSIHFSNILLIILSLWACRGASLTLNESSMLERYEQWMVQYGRVYNDATEKETRFEIFKENVKHIESLNRAGNRTYMLSVNGFADQTNEEFKAARNGYKGLCTLAKPLHVTPFRYKNSTTVPSSMDWGKKGAVTPVKDQGQCVAAMEGTTQLKIGKLISLSEQELVDCDTKGMDQVCEGGEMDDAFLFVQCNKGITSETTYPYTAADNTCNTKEEASHAAEISVHEDVPRNSEVALLQAVVNQPIAVAIDAGGSDFQFYSSGVFTGQCVIDLDHGVTAVGYGVSNDGTKYWLVKNSWGSAYGVRMDT